MGHKTLQGLRPLLCVLCCLSDLENPGRKEKKLNFSHLPSIHTCEVIEHFRQGPPSNVVVVSAGVAVSLGRVSQPMELVVVLAPLSKALCGGGPPDAYRRVTVRTHLAALGTSVVMPGSLAPSTVAATTTLSAGKSITFPNRSGYFLLLF